MIDSLTLTLVTPNGLIEKSDLVFVGMKTEKGELGIYPNHSPLLASLTSGWIHVTDSKNGHDFLFVQSGFAEVTPTGIRIITPAVETVSEVDLDQARDELNSAENRLASRHEAFDITEALAARDLAKARLEILDRRSS